MKKIPVKAKKEFCEEYPLPNNFNCCKLQKFTYDISSKKVIKQALVDINSIAIARISCNPTPVRVSVIDVFGITFDFQLDEKEFKLYKEGIECFNTGCAPDAMLCCATLSTDFGVPMNNRLVETSLILIDPSQKV